MLSNYGFSRNIPFAVSRLAFAAANAALVRSLMSSRSFCAIAA